MARNPAHNFALARTMQVYRSRALYTLIPKNACSTIRFSIALANGAVRGLDDIDWIHENNQSFVATTADAFRASYTFVILRCPFARLASAFLDKIVDFNINAWDAGLSVHDGVHPHDRTFRQFVHAVAARPPPSLDIHWRPQSHFLLYARYDDVFAFEDLDGAFPIIEKRAGLRIVDTRGALGHDTSRLERVAMSDPADRPAFDLLSEKRAGRIPAPEMLFDDGIVAAIRKLYAGDLALYESLFGRSRLMERFAG